MLTPKGLSYKTKMAYFFMKQKLEEHETLKELDEEIKKITSILNLKNEHKMLFNKAFEKISDLELFYAYKLIENTIKKS